MTKKLQPKLRFRGFTDAWEQRKLGTVCSFKKGQGYSKRDIQDSGSPLLLYGQMYTNYSSVISDTDAFAEERPNSIRSTGREVVIPASGETQEDIAVASAVVKPGILYGGDLNILTPRSYLNPVFLALAVTGGPAHRLLAEKAQGKTIVHLRGADIVQANIAYPSVDEQSSIANLFMKMERLIAAEKRKLNLLKDKKTALLQQIFTQKIRFKDYDEPWKLRKLGDLYEANHERNDQGLTASKTLSVSTMSFNNQGNGAEESSLFNYKILRIGDIAFEGHQAKTHPYGRFVLNDVGVGIMSPRFTSLRPKREQIISFWKYYINNETIMDKILVFSTKAGTMMNELVVDDFRQQLLCVPSKEEQRAIGNLFIELDSLVAAETRKVDLLELKKKSLLQQMFV